MIIKASQRGDAAQLATYLLNESRNDHVEVILIQGFASNDLHEAFDEADRIAQGTKAKQHLFSISLNPPKGHEVELEDFEAAARRAGKAVGLDGQPFAIVTHENDGRRHAHVVWSRIDADKMKAINLPFFKERLAELSKQLFLEHGWELPEGHRDRNQPSNEQSKSSRDRSKSNPLNFTLKEWQQAKREGQDPREVKKLFREAWEQSHDAESFQKALGERGYILARGDKRAYVAVDINGEVHSLSRATGVKRKELEKRLGSPEKLPSVEDAQLKLRTEVSRSVRDFLGEMKRELKERERPLLEEKQKLLIAQREERETLRRLQAKRRVRQAGERQARMHTGIRGLLDILIGRAAALRRLYQQDARDTWIKDRRQRESLFMGQREERRDLQDRIDAMRFEHRTILLQAARVIGRSMNPPDRVNEQVPVHILTRERGVDYDLGL